MIVLLLAAGCSPAGPERVAPVLTISPPPGSGPVRPDQHLVVTATGTTLGAVTTTVAGRPVPGTFDVGRTRWRSSWPLAPGRAYDVAAAATADGTPVTTTARIHTFAAKRTVRVAAVSPRPGETVGVGMPIIVTFDAPVSRRAPVEHALRVDAGDDVEGAWRWVSENQVIYRPRRFWPAGRHVTLTAHLTGVRIGKDTYGTADHSTGFTVGRRQLSTIDTTAKQMVVRRSGEVVQRMAISAGNGSTYEYTTTSGIHLTMERDNPVRMVSPGRSVGDPGYYDLRVDHAVRISNSGEYVHAMDNLWAQGVANTSHGCINAAPGQAAWFYAHSLRGDPVIITGTDRELGWDNGWGYWQLSWKEWLSGSALSLL
ncbi:L,D-transpeptidase family protein [Streptosporangium sp. KLBMP 9127]|nr:Ig-like domain-containing protein [Streptosporangium sp. KLBMP 9127]